MPAARGWKDVLHCMAVMRVKECSTLLAESLAAFKLQHTTVTV